MEIYELNFVLILLGKTEFFADNIFFFLPQIKLPSVNRFQSTKCFCNGGAKGVHIKLSFMETYKIAKT